MCKELQQKLVANRGKFCQILPKAGKNMAKAGRKSGFWRPFFIKICQLRRLMSIAKSRLHRNGRPLRPSAVLEYTGFEFPLSPKVIR